MDIGQIINEYLEITESYQLPDKLMECLLDPLRKTELFDKVMETGPELSIDTMFEYFQTEHGDRTNLKQDFTPDAICEIVARLSNSKAKTVYDVCSGTGGLSIKQINKNPEATYYFEEISERTAPLLLFNLAIRNIKAYVKLGDSLKNEFKEVYKLERSDKYSEITVSKAEAVKADLVITNPPYSLKWDQIEDERFEYGLAPKSKADYAFILHAFSKLTDDGEMYAILPHGVLFRGAAEGKIRQRLIEENLIDMIIGLPGKMFLNTDIPTVILKLKKNRETKDIYFIEASEECIQEGRFNVMKEEHISAVIGAANMRRAIKRFADVADLEKIKENDYNLNLPRYVDTHIPEPVPDLAENVREYFEICRELRQLEYELFPMFAQMVDSTPEGQKELDEVNKLWQEHQQLMIDGLSK